MPPFPSPFKKKKKGFSKENEQKKDTHVKMQVCDKEPKKKLHLSKLREKDLRKKKNPIEESEGGAVRAVNSLTSGQSMCSAISDYWPLCRSVSRQGI